MSEDVKRANMWVDPPNGWIYNFPKIYDETKDGPDVYEWIIKEGYPRKLAESYGKQFHYRMWEVKNESIR